MRHHRASAGIAIAALLGGAVTVAPALAVTAQASMDGSGVVINEAYLSGGSAGAAYRNKFVELYNPGSASVDLSGWSLQYRSATSTGSATGVTPLGGSIASHGYYLVQGGSNGTSGAELPTPDATGTLNPSGTTGTLILADTASALSPAAGSVTGADHIVDLLGYGTSNTFEGADAAAPASNTDVKSLDRTNFADTDHNDADFSLSATITPQDSQGGTAPTGPTDPVALTIAQIQGSTDVSPESGVLVTTKGVVTAAYPTGGFNGYYLQTPGTGGTIDLAAHTASDGVFVYSASTVSTVKVGDYVQVTGTVSEFDHLTEIAVTGAADLTELDAAGVTPPAPARVAFPATDAQRESLEGMLIAPQGDYTVTDNYDTNQYGEIALAHDTAPLLQPTAVAAYGTPEYQAVVAKNAAELVTLDDGSSINFLGSTANKNTPLPWLSLSTPVRIGAAATFTKPVVLDYRNDLWKLQPTAQLTPADAAEVQPVTFANTRTDAPKNVGGNIHLATFNVLNYFPTTGDQRSGCTYYTDRDGNPIEVKDSDDPGCGVRGAATQASFQRQQAKIATAISKLGADVVSLEEIENSAKVGEDRDAALSNLVDALNAKAGSAVWAYVPSPPASALPPIDQQDVIRTALIYKTASIQTVGASTVLVGSSAFSDAREPLAQAFKPVGGTDGSTFLVIVNHFKSKSADAATTGDTVDAGQGAFNGDRVRQAQALLAFAQQRQTAAKTDKVFLVGDFNSYEKEDPITTIAGAGYIDQDPKTGKQTYAYGGMVGSLDHVFASPAADKAITGQDVWNINSVESVGLEYDRYNYNAVNLYDGSQFRSSDHDPAVIGLQLPVKADNGGGPHPGTPSLKDIIQALFDLLRHLFGGH